MAQVKSGWCCKRQLKGDSVGYLVERRQCEAAGEGETVRDGRP